MLRDDDILATANSTVIREEEESDRILLFNSLSDEMYLVPKQALQVLKLCRGALTARQIEDALTVGSKESAEDEERTLVRRFLQQLVDRKLLEVLTPEIVIHRRLKYIESISRE